MQIPGPLRTLFTTFPLTTHPAVPQLASDEKAALEARLFSYSPRTTDVSSSFKLAVYNVTTEATTYIATDPVCLALELALSLQYGIKLPKVNHEHKMTNDSLFLVSHQASRNGQLPFLIEQDSKLTAKRTVKDFTGINERYLAKVSRASDLMLISLVDAVFYDGWIVGVLSLSAEDQSIVYQFCEGTPGMQLTNRAALPSLIQGLCHRLGFNERNPNIVKSLGNLSFVAVDVVNKEKKRALQGFERSLNELTSVLESRDSKFFHGEGPGLLDVKIASYLVLMGKFLKDTDLGAVLEKEGQLLKTHAGTVLKWCM